MPSGTRCPLLVVSSLPLIGQPELSPEGLTSALRAGDLSIAGDLAKFTGSDSGSPALSASALDTGKACAGRHLGLRWRGSIWRGRATGTAAGGPGGSPGTVVLAPVGRVAGGPGGRAFGLLVADCPLPAGELATAAGGIAGGPGGNAGKPVLAVAGGDTPGAVPGSAGVVVRPPANWAVVGGIEGTADGAGTWPGDCAATARGGDDGLVFARSVVSTGGLPTFGSMGSLDFHCMRQFSGDGGSADWFCSAVLTCAGLEESPDLSDAMAPWPCCVVLGRSALKFGTGGRANATCGGVVF